MAREYVCSPETEREEAPLDEAWSLHNPFSSISSSCQESGPKGTCAWHVFQAAGAEVRTTVGHVDYGWQCTALNHCDMGLVLFPPCL